MKATLKSMIAKVMTAGLLAGVFMLGGAKKAEAQVAVGVRIGRPVVYPGYPVYGAYPGYYRRDDYYARMRWEAARRAEWERQQAWARHEQWERSRYYGPRPYGYYGR